MKLLHEENFNELIARFFQSSPARDALINFERKRLTGSPLFCPSDHRRRLATNLEVANQHRSLRALLDGFSIIEIASICGVIPTPLPKAFSDEAVAVLADPEFHQYWLHEPGRAALSTQFLYRVLGNQTPPFFEGADGFIPFAQFLELSEAIQQDANVGEFLDFLEAVRDNAANLDPIRIATANPNIFLKAATESEYSNVLTGYRRYIDFCAEFDVLLQRHANQKIFTAAIWNYHSSVFGTLGPILCFFVEMVLTSQLEWLNDVKEFEKVDAIESAKQIFFVVKRLMDYGTLGNPGGAGGNSGNDPTSSPSPNYYYAQNQFFVGR